MTHLRQMWLVGSVSVASVLFCVSTALAKKPDKPGGGSGSDIPEFELVQLDPGGSWSSARAISDAGIVVGQADGVAGYWDANAETPTFTPLPAAGMDVAYTAYDVNQADEIIGQGPSGPMYWASLTATPIVLPVPAGRQPNPKAISRDGVIVGELIDAAGSSAAAWRVTGGSIFGPTIISNDAVATDVASIAYGTNRVVGQAVDANGTPVATAWDLSLQSDGSFDVTSSTTLIPGQLSWAKAITQAGDITGKVTDVFGVELNRRDTAFVIRDGSLDLLPRGKQNDYADGTALNDTDVIGVVGPNWSAASPALWDSRHRLDDLTPDYFGEDWSFNTPYGVNSRGDIVGFGKFASTDATAAWLLRHPLSSAASSTAVPEPSTGALVVAALAVLGIATRRSWCVACS